MNDDLLLIINMFRQIYIVWFCRKHTSEQLPSEPNGEIQSLYKWFPEEKQWWITGFDYSKHRVNANSLVNIGYLDFSGDTDMFEKIFQSENYYLNTNLEEPQKLYPFLNFDSENYYVWLIW